MDELPWLERWFQSRCDGNWEHERGLSIQTCDNPGWWVKIDIDKEPRAWAADEVLEIVGEPPSEINGNVGGEDWMLCQIKDGKFDGSGDPTKLMRILKCFKDRVSGPIP